MSEQEKREKKKPVRKPATNQSTRPIISPCSVRITRSNTPLTHHETRERPIKRRLAQLFSEQDKVVTDNRENTIEENTEETESENEVETVESNIDQAKSPDPIVEPEKPPESPEEKHSDPPKISPENPSNEPSTSEATIKPILNLNINASQDPFKRQESPISSPISPSNPFANLLLNSPPIEDKQEKTEKKIMSFTPFQMVELVPKCSKT